MQYRLRALGLGGLAAGALAACTLQNANVAEGTLMTQFQSGTAVLSCTSNCELSWQKARPNALAMFNAEQWQPLAVLVMRVGYGNDLTYYYLGRAADALHFPNAAEVYYKDSEAASQTATACARGSSVAQGIQSLGSAILSGVANSTAQTAGNTALNHPALDTGNACDGFVFPDNAATSLQIVEAELNPPVEQKHVVKRRVVKKSTTTASSSSASSSAGIVEAPSSSSGGAAPAKPASSSGIVEAK